MTNSSVELGTESAAVVRPGRKPGSRRAALAIPISVVWVLWQAYVAVTTPLAPVPMRTIHLMFGFVLAFLLFPGWLSKRSRSFGALADACFALAALYMLVHLLWEFNPPEFHRIVDPLPMDLLLAALMIVVVLTAVWRTTGAPLVITVLVFILYAFLGDNIPGAAGHGGYAPERVLAILYLDLNGLLGSTVGVSATMIFPVLLFGGMLVALGGGDFFTDLALGFFGRVRGASAKVSVLSSAMFATVAGTGGANVATTGVFTIPLMKRTGYRGSTAAAVESAASIGGQIMPPVMGAAAFIMVEFVGVPYGTIVRHALVPAALFFLAVFLTVHLDAVKTRKLALPPDQIPNKRSVLRTGWHFVPPLVLLIYMIAVEQSSVAKAAFWATTLLILLDLGKRAVLRQPIGWGRLVDGCLATAKSGVLVVCAVAAIQLLIAVVGLTGLGIKLSTLLLTLAGGSLIALLVLTMLASLLLGTGLPTVPTYLVLAVLTAPALTEFGVPIIVAHFFVFYFGVWSDLTPPTALGPTIGAGIAGAPLMRTQFESLRFALLGFILPFAFVYQPALLMIGTVDEILMAIAATTVAVLVACIGIVGYFRQRLPLHVRGGFLVSSALLIVPDPYLKALGLGLAAVLLLPYTRRRKLAPPADLATTQLRLGEST